MCQLKQPRQLGQQKRWGQFSRVNVVAASMNNSSETGNGTQSPPSECSSNTQSSAVQYIKAVVYLGLLLLALIGNVLVIWIVHKKRRMHTATNFLIVNMAVGDLLMAVLSMIPTAVSMLRNSYTWVDDGPFGQITCKLLIFAQGSSMACSIFTLTVLAFERFFAVVYPMWNVVTKRRTTWLILAIWVASLASHSPMLYAAKVQLFDGTPYCYENWAPAFDPRRASAVFTVVSFMLLYALPLLLITGLYSVIVTKVWFRNIPGNATPENVRLLNKAKRNVLKMLITVVLAFALCWFVMHLNVFLMDFTDVFQPCGIPVGLQTTGFLFGHANSAINFCIYAIFSQDYRRGFKEILKPLLPRRSLTLLLNRSRSDQVATIEASSVQQSSSGSPRMRSFKRLEQTKF